MKIVVEKLAAKDIQKISEPYKSSIKAKIKNLEQYPNLANIKKLTNYTPSYRLRVGDYRVLFDIKDELIVIARIRHRKEAY